MQEPFDIVVETALKDGTNNCVWSPDRSLFCLSGDPDEWSAHINVRVYKTESGELMCYHQVENPPASGERKYSSCRASVPTFSHDSRRLLFAQSVFWRDAAEGEAESLTSIWDLHSTEPPWRLTNHGAAVVDAMFNPVNPDQVFLRLSDDTIQVRDVATATILSTLDIGLGQEQQRPSSGRDVGIETLYSPSGIHIATALQDGRHGHVWRVPESGTVSDALWGAHPRRVSWMAFSPDGTRLLSTSHDTAAQLWDTRTGRAVLSLQAHIDPVNAAAFSSDGRYVGTGYKDGSVRVWDVEDGTCLAVYTEHSSPVSHLVFSENGRIVCSGAEDGTVYIRRCPFKSAVFSLGARFGEWVTLDIVESRC